MKTRNGITAFAAVELTSQDSDKWAVCWGDAATQLRPVYGSAVDGGIQLARNAHEERGGVPQQITIVSLSETTSDTRADAMRCATAIALWKAWGYSESEVTAAFVDGEWRVRFD